MVYKWDKVVNIKNMLIGEYKHTIDDKNRISLPSKFRSELGKKIVITRGLDNCLFIYSEKEWKQIAEKLGTMGFGQADTRGFNRFMLSGAMEMSIDGAGRVLLPEHLRSFARLGSKAVFAGVYNRVEIWDENLWSEYNQKVLSKADEMAETLGDIGAI
jgi:MraZ protein